MQKSPHVPFLPDAKEAMIFWRYDHFPYVLCSPGKLVTKDLAWCPSYMAYFKPVMILPLRKGRTLAKQLNSLRAQFERDNRITRNIYMDRLAKLLPWLKNPTSSS